MLRTTVYCTTILISSALVTLAAAGEGKVVITVERPKPAADVHATPPFHGHRPAVDVAILLDTSNSMDGLLSQAKTQLWTIVQQFAKAKKNGHTPLLRVALFEYGNTRLPAAEGYIRQVVPLTDDLDQLSEALFALTTNGGDEYCGQVINEAITRLDWSKEPRSYKAIFIAGNEPFTQGSVDYQAACKRAIEHGIVVNTIHCGDSSAGISGKWQHGAQLAEGEFFNIDQDRVVVPIKCPQDDIIIRLNAELNKTYLWYGRRDDRARNAANQVAQDSNAVAASAPTAAARIATKAGELYAKPGADLVDAVKQDGEILKKLKTEELPELLQNLPADSREARVKDMAAKRAEVQKQINLLTVERDAYVAQEQKRQATPSADATLGDAVVSAIRKQLTKCGFETAPKAE